QDDWSLDVFPSRYLEGVTRRGRVRHHHVVVCAVRPPASCPRGLPHPAHAHLLSHPPRRRPAVPGRPPLGRHTAHHTAPRRVTRRGRVEHHQVVVCAVPPPAS